MIRALEWVSSVLVLLFAGQMLAQGQQLEIPSRLRAGAAFSVRTSGTGKAELYLVGLGQVLHRTVTLGEPVSFAEGELYHAGHYVALLVGPSSSEKAEFDVSPTAQAASLSFLAKPSRLPVSRPDGISGVVYVFDAYHNLILQPLPVAFELSGNAGAAQKQVSTRNGVAWVRMNSSPKAGMTDFQATAGGVSEKRVLQQFPGDPCGLRMSARPSGGKVALQTEPVHDCNGNPVPDGTIVTFTESYGGHQTTVDVPVKRDIARTEVPAHPGAVIAVASGVVMGNEIHLGGTK